MKSQKEIYFVEYNVFLTNQLFTRDLIWDIDSNLSTGLDIGLAYEEIKKVLQDWAARGLVSQEEAQMQESQERQLEAQEEEAQVEEA